MLYNYISKLYLLFIILKIIAFSSFVILSLSIVIVTWHCTLELLLLPCKSWLITFDLSLWTCTSWPVSLWLLICHIIAYCSFFGDGQTYPLTDLIYRVSESSFIKKSFFKRKSLFVIRRFILRRHLNQLIQKCPLSQMSVVLAGHASSSWLSGNVCWRVVQ